jgi:hypothetical protein
VKPIFRLLLPLLLVALVGSVAWSLALRARLRTEIARSTALASALDAARARPAAPAPVSFTPVTVTASASEPAGEGESGPVSLGPGAELFDQPVVLDLLAAAVHDSLDPRYGTFFRQLQLAPRQLEHLKNLLVERQMSALDVVRAAHARGLSATEAEAVLAESADMLDSNIRSLLGQPGFERFKAYERDIDTHGLLNQLETRIGYGAPPLSPEQSDAVLRVLAETTEPASSPADDRTDPLARALRNTGLSSSLVAPKGRRITDRTLAAARSVLNEAQLEALAQLRSEQEAPPP